MADNKDLKLEQSSADLQIGKAGPRLKSSAGIVEARNSTDSAFSVVRGGSPVDDEDASTKSWSLTNIGDSPIPFGIVRKSDTTGTDSYTLPAVAAGDIINVSKHSSKQMTNILRISPASGDKISVYGNVIENPGYIEVNNPAFSFKFAGLNSDVWALVSDFNFVDYRNLTSHQNYSLSGRNTWVSKTANGTGRSEAAGFSLNGYCYLTGGIVAGTHSGIHDQYNDVTNAWASKTADPSPRYDQYGCNLNGFGYIVCGYNDSTLYSGANTQYNDLANTWASKTVNPTIRASILASSLNGYSYATGGQNGTVQSIHNQYNDSSNAWTAKTAYPIVIYIPSGWALNGFVYMTHGISSGSARQSVQYQYNDKANAWITKTSNPEAKYGASSFINNGYGYTVCGITTVNVNSVHEYNDNLNIWTTKTVNPTARRYSVGNFINGYGYATSGYDGSVNTGTHEQYN